MIAEMLAIAACAAADDAVAQSVREVRASFNRAIADKNIDTISRVLTDNVVLVTGTDSTQFLGREAQLAIWSEDFSKNDRLVYERKTDCVMPSPLYPIAIETGAWRGAPERDAGDFVSGLYTAKWRLADGEWRLEAETFMTTGCGGALCPIPASESQP